MTVSDCGLALLALARRCGDRHFDPSTGLCLIPRDTCWYAIGLLFDPAAERRAMGERILSSLQSEDGTHTPATIIAVLRSLPEMLAPPVRESLRLRVIEELVHAAETEWNDGNVNHPLGAYCTLVCGGEMAGARWAVDLGARRLRRFRQRIGSHRSVSLRQAEMSEYHSLTYTPLSLCFLALIAEYAADPAARETALALEQGLWRDVAMHFHAPTEQWAGPHSRSYQEDSSGGYSALHGAWMAAGLGAIYSNPSLSERFEHPSDLLQNALTAIVPFHAPDDARTLAWEKPFPYTFRKTTFAESYRENSRRPASGEFVFDEEVYPGGWTDLTTHMTGEYALGSAARPYVNAGHADAVMLRVRRNDRIGGMADFRSMFTRGVYNGARPGERNLCHTTGGEIDASYLYEEGRSFTYQHENRLIVCYCPKRAGHRGVKRFSVDLIFTAHAPFDDIAVDGRPADPLPVAAGAGSRICLRDHRTYILIAPLAPTPGAGPFPVSIRAAGEFLVVSIASYDGPERDFTRDDVNAWRGGFAMEVRTSDEFTGWQEFLAHAGAISLEEECSPRGVRSIALASGGHRMAFSVDPFREEIIARTWDGGEDAVDHFRVSAAGSEAGPFCPRTLFGDEAAE